MSKSLLLPSEIARLRSAKYPRGEMSPPEKKKLFEENPEFKEMNENPPPEVVKVMDEMQKKAYAQLLPSERVALENKKARYLYVVTPEQIIARALMNRLLSSAEANTREVRQSAENEAERLAESWPEDEGFGSSDMTYSVQNMLNNAGFKADFVGGRLQRLDKVASQKLNARFHEGPKGEKEFKAWMKNQPKEVQEDWDKYNEENKDKFKTAYLDPAQGEATKHFLTHILAALRAQYLMYQTAHWQTKGLAYYGNHLLFQRLYESVESEIDAVAEKLVGYTGVSSVHLPDQMVLMQAYCSRWCSVEDLHLRGLQSEKDIQNLLKTAYESLKAQDSLTLGLDDWLMATASSHESHTYLLQQVLA